MNLMNLSAKRAFFSNVAKNRCIEIRNTVTSVELDVEIISS